MDYKKLIDLYAGRITQTSEFSLVDHRDGNGIQIEYWNILDKPQPTMEQLEALQPQAKEIERLLMKTTPREFVLALIELGVTRTQVSELLDTNDKAWAELTFATCIVRGNPLLDELCANLGVTGTQLDDIFKSLQKENG